MNRNPNLDNLKPFKPGQSGNPAGPPRKVLSLLTDQGYKKSEVLATYAALLSMTVDELKAVFENPKSTLLERTVAHALYKNFKSGEMKNIESVLARLLGAPTQDILSGGEALKAPIIQIIKPE